MLPLLFLCYVLGWGNLAQAALSYDTNVSAAQLSSIIDGPGLSISNLTVTRGVAGQYGVFAGGEIF